MGIPATVVLYDKLGLATFTVALLMQVTVCTQGLATAIIYGGLLTKLYRVVSCKPFAVPAHKFVASSSFPTMDTTNTILSLVKHYRQPANIFVSTFNMGEAKLTPAQLGKWIPLGHDVYVIGLQECLHLADTRSLICQHLEGGRPRPAANRAACRKSTFHQFNREIGSKNKSLGYHGHIAITVFIKSSDVDSGAFYMPPVVQQEVNGKSKVWRRNRDSQDMLQELHLNLEDVGFEFPHVHHHSFVLGDLNYRLTQRDASANTILEMVSKVRQCETLKPAPTKRTRRLRRGLLGKRWSPMESRGLASSFGLGSSQGASSDREINELGVSMLERSVKNASSVFASSNESIYSMQFSADSERVDDDHFVWDDVLLHDELRAGMRSGQIFYGFREAKIAFPPTFRRVRGAALKLDEANWSIHELTKCYTTAVAGHGMRVPSYTDRILFFSQPDMRHRLRCAVYASCEEVSCSDHKPVIAVFQALVNRDFLPIETELSTKKLQRMQDVHGVLECQLRLSFSSMSWQPDAAADFSRTSSSTPIDIDQRFSSFDRHGHQVMVTTVFPLPSEDIFSAQRKLLELADSMSGGVYLQNTDRLLCKTNVAHVKWTDFVRDGITHATCARPTGNMHVAIKIHAGSQGPCFGQGVICIPQTTADDGGDPADGVQKQNNFVVELAHGGRHTGIMSGFVSLQLLQHANDA
uniref:Inositol polyphosphate-related phosphatase domain-containing protein n=1 Tax=Hyaloperonospora arabidopsidis (strain Emoy2) TaxID=559515 RepID=M4B4J2_HYAAE